MMIVLRTLVVIALAVVLSGTVASPRASASEVSIGRALGAKDVSGDGSGSIGHVSVHNGNGQGHVDHSTIMSPTTNRASLQVANTSITGKTITKLIVERNKFCCSHRHRRRR